MLLIILTNLAKYVLSVMSLLRNMAGTARRVNPTKIEPLILAIDVGIKNMAYCYLKKDADTSDFTFNGKEYRIMALDKLALGEWGNSTEKLVKKLAEDFHGVLDEHGRPDVVVIEKQLAQSSTLRQLQFCIQSFVLGKFPFSPKIVFQSGKDKLRLCDQIDLYNERSRLKSAYRANKIVGEKTALKILDGTEWHSVLCDNKKSDDLSDAFLHALYYAHKIK